jgi:hypothetical protein
MRTRLILFLIILSPRGDYTRGSSPPGLDFINKILFSIIFILGKHTIISFLEFSSDKTVPLRKGP